MYENKLQMFMPTTENINIISFFISRCTSMSRQFVLVVDQVSARPSIILDTRVASKATFTDLKPKWVEKKTLLNENVLSTSISH